jgi:epoxyqueuosine reductase
MSLTNEIRALALQLGFSAVGFAPARALAQDGEALARWLATGFQGEMGWMARDPERRWRPDRVLPGARSVVVVALNYYAPDATPAPAGATGRVARYAWGRDYHAVIEPRLEQLAAFVRARGGPSTACRAMVDHGPALEKAWAREAGLGFIGKNTLLITERDGSWVFLGLLLTTLTLEPDVAQTSQCGGCRRCLDACPTGALVAPYQLDARRCIAYLTIEHRGPIPDDLAPRLGDWVFGCDICQNVCPYNAHPTATSEPAFDPHQGVGARLDLAAVLALESDAAFQGAFGGTPLLRPKRPGLIRNARNAASNERASAAVGGGSGAADA